MTRVESERRRARLRRQAHDWFIPPKVWFVTGALLIVVLAIVLSVISQIAIDWIEAPLLANPPASATGAAATRIVIMLFGIVAAVLVVVLLTLMRKTFFGHQAVFLRAEQGTGRAVVIMGLSKLENVAQADGQIGRGKYDADVKELSEKGFEQASRSVKEMEQDGLIWRDATNPDRLNGPGALTIVQNFRALSPHRLDNRLEFVVIVPSRETAAFAPAFARTLREMLANQNKDKATFKPVTVRVLGDRGEDEATDLDQSAIPAYEDYEQVRNGILSARRLALKAGFSDRDICIDATTGIKTFSIAAATVTLNHDMLFSYVITLGQPEGGEVRLYDTTIDLVAFLESGF